VPTGDELTELQFHMLVGEVLEDEHGTAANVEALVKAPNYDSSVSHRGLDCAGTVKDQGGCGSCWAFAATAAFESAYCMENGTLHDLSEQAAIDCRADMATVDNRCADGNTELAYDVMRSRGLESEFALEYSDSASSGCPAPREGEPVFRIDGTAYLTAPRVEEVKEAVVRSGAVTIAFAVTPAFDNYVSGGMPIVTSDADLMSVRGFHMIVIVGWDDARGAWRVKNSWGTDGGWGDLGWGWLTYNDKSIHPLGYSVALPQREYSEDAKIFLVNQLVDRVLETDLLTSDPTVQWPTSLGFPEEALTVNEGVAYATDQGLYTMGNETP
jgi:C1A family cysteine protease